jgi:hypothetical protein
MKLAPVRAEIRRSLGSSDAIFNTQFLVAAAWAREFTTLYTARPIEAHTCPYAEVSGKKQEDYRGAELAAGICKPGND